MLDVYYVCVDHLCYSNVFPVLGFILSFEHGKSYYSGVQIVVYYNASCSVCNA